MSTMFLLKLIKVTEINETTVIQFLLCKLTRILFHHITLLVAAFGDQCKIYN